ncbi:MAG: hypothetical protein ACI4TV_04565 [Paludibacteraceae bacterium]
MARKSVNFNITEETYSRLRTYFPEGQALGTDDNMLQLLDALAFYQAHKDDKPASISDEELQALRERLQKAEQDFEQSNAQVIDLDRRLQAAMLEQEQHATAANTLQEQNLQLARTVSDQEQTIKALQSMQPTWEQMRSMIQPFPVALLEETAARLTERYKRDITPLQILVDMFLRYTIDRNAEWFYPFVLRDKDIVAIAHELNENVVSIQQIRKSLQR